MPVEDKEVERTRAEEEFWCHHPEVTTKAIRIEFLYYGENLKRKEQWAKKSFQAMTVR